VVFYSEEPRNEEGGGEAPPGGLTDADFDSNWDEAIETFDGMDLPEELLRGIYSYGFEKPSANQQRAIRPTMMGRDLIAQAQSGTVRLYILDLFACFSCATTTYSYCTFVAYSTRGAVVVVVVVLASFCHDRKG
jgi:superfamily II DNA/RNA helicase